MIFINSPISIITVMITINYDVDDVAYDVVYDDDDDDDNGADVVADVVADDDDNDDDNVVVDDDDDNDYNVVDDRNNVSYQKILLSHRALFDFFLCRQSLSDSYSHLQAYLHTFQLSIGSR